MSKPKFWRLKRRSENKVQASVNNPLSVSQKTISSFFGVQNVPTNLGEDAEGGAKRPKLEQFVSDSSAKVPVVLSDNILSKLQSFSTGTQRESSFERVSQNGQESIIKGASTLSQSSDHFTGTEDNASSSESKLSSKISLDSFKLEYQDISRRLDHIKHTKLGKVKYTPLEQQVIDIWEENPDVLLFVECGYKYRFFGKDAEIAAQELNIYAHMDHNFMTASIPVHRLHAHVGRLVEKGYKVGVVKQIETAALKAMSDKKNAPFSRKLEHLYTRATLIGEDVDAIDEQTDKDVPPGHIFCFHEAQSEPKSMCITFVTVNPSTGECYYEQFSDTACRDELQKRLQIVNPAEILCPPHLSNDSERLLNHFHARVERLPQQYFETTDALTRATSYFASGTNGMSESTALEGLMELPPLVLSCLAALQQHLNEFGLQRAIQLDGLQGLPSGKGYLHLDSSTIRNLHLLRSDSGNSHGSLFWALNHTKTKFGARLLLKWLVQPVRTKEVLEERQERLSELLGVDQVIVSHLKSILSSLPDLDKGLTTILHNKCSPVQFFTILDAMCTLHSDFSSLLSLLGKESTAPHLLKTIQDTIDLLDDVQAYRDNISVTAAKDGDKTKLLKDFSAFPNVVKLMNDIEDCLKSLDNLRPQISQKLSLFSVQYICVSGQEYLIEVKNTNARNVPENWRKISSTKQVSRFRPPAVDQLYGELQRLREMLRAECQKAWIALLQEFSEQYFRYKQAVSKVACIDVVLSLAHVAQQEGYCRPNLIDSEESRIVIKNGRHPVLPLLFSSAGQFVPNDTNLNSSGECCMVLSGPNMGGKSCYIRQVALIALLAHVGSYVPAEYAEISLLESIFTRMGARDELFNGRSTLMVELEETAAILKKASKHSLVLLDELGRGTGSCDGSAIACATLRHITLEIRCLALFVTHYPPVMDTADELQGKAGNYHMAFVLHDKGEAELLTFLYEVAKGAADRSYGINVARLANLSQHLLQRAAAVATDLEKQAKYRREIRQSFLDVWQKK